MRGSKAKLLRKDAKILAAGLDYVNYDRVNIQTKYHMGFDEKGLPKPTPYQTHTAILGACERAEYKRIKSVHKHYGNELSKNF